MQASNLDDLLFIHQRFALAENKSQRTIEAVTEAVRHFNDFLGGSVDVTQVQAEDLRLYIRCLQQRNKWAGHPTIKSRDDHLSPHSIASYIRNIRSFWSWLKREDFIEENPLERIKPPKAPRKIVSPLTNEQVTQLLKVIPHRDKSGYRDLAVVITLYGTGLRVGELLGLKLSDVNFESGQIKVMGKGGKERSVYMSATVYKVLIKYLWHWRPRVASDYFFAHDSGEPLSRFYVAHRLRVHGKKAGLTGVRCSPHALRHSFAVNYLRNGGDTFTLQRILGHSTLEMTRHYAEVADSDVEIKQKAFSPAEKLRLRV